MNRKETELTNLLENVFNKLAQAHTILLRINDSDFDSSAMQEKRKREQISQIKIIETMIQEIKHQLQIEIED